MSRFSRLDFDEKPLVPAIPGIEADRWPDQDEASCLKSGDDLFHTGRYEPALLAYSRALRFNRDCVDAWVGQIRCLCCLGEYLEAVTWSHRAQERFPQSADVLACKGFALSHVGNVAEGVEFLDGAVEMKSPSAWVWLARGECLLLNRQTTENAHRCFFKALEQTPTDARLELRIGIAYNRARLYARARTSLQSSVKRDDRNPLALYEMGRALEGLGEREAAVGMYARAMALRPQFTEATDAHERAARTGPLKALLARMRRRRDG